MRGRLRGKHLILTAAAGLFFNAATGHEVEQMLTQSREQASANRHEQAIAFALRALEEATRVYGANDTRLVPILEQLELSYRALNRFREAGHVRREVFLIKLKAEQKHTAPPQAGEVGISEPFKPQDHHQNYYASAPNSGRRLGGCGGCARGIPERQELSGPAARQDMPRPSTSASASAARGVKPAADTLPSFPWPPPAASTFEVLPALWFEKFSTVGEVSAGILSALEKSGYVERSFFRTDDDGVALVTRLERIDPDGTPKDPRWALGLEAEQFNIASFVRGLFFVSPGRYRVIVFILQDRFFRQSGETASEAQAKEWLRSGANRLPPDVEGRAFNDGTVTALIYEFASEAGQVKLVDSEITTRQHLEKAGLSAGLSLLNGSKQQ